MNNDEKNPGNQAEAEIEARIVAWVSGEASAFEAAELERLVREKPELAIFKRRIEAVRGLVADAVSREKEPLRLSPERRAKLLQSIGVPEAPAPADAPVVPSLAVAIQRHRTQRRWMLAVAACLVCGLFLSITIPSFRRDGLRQAGYAVEHASLGASKSVPLQMPVAIEEMTATEEAKKLDREEPRAQGMVSARAIESRPATVQMPAIKRERVDSAELARQSGVGGNFPETSYAAGSPRREARLEGDIAVDKEAPAALQPFEVPETEENQNKANSTLAGARVRTDLKDTQEGISVVTAEALQDAQAAPLAFNGAAANGAGNEASNASDSLAVVTNSFSQDTGATDLKNAADVDALSLAGGAGALQKAKESSLLAWDGITLAAPAAELGARSSALAKQEIAGQQQAPANAPGAPGAYDEPIALSPFTVQGAQDKGNYKANSTLAGTRVSTELDDVASSNSVVTGQFLKDAGGKYANKAPGGGAIAPAEAAGEASASKEPVSTFSLHVSDVSFRLAREALARGEVPDPSRIRPEEFYNAFDYGDPAPAMAEKVSCRIEQAADPVRQQRNLVRIAMRVPATGHGAGQPLRLTVLLDTSGSMEREDRAAAVRRAMEVLTSLLGPRDRITLLGFARQPRLLAEHVAGDKAGQLLDIISRTPAEGGTNLEEALKAGAELARRQFMATAQNRIVLLTDGAANLGNADPAQLAASIATLRQQGISFDACGVGMDGINDEVLEALTRKGAGRYYVVDTPESADAGFARQLAGAFRPAAENVKVQVRFNPSRVGNYRLIGFEQHRLNEADFRNDKVEAAALAAGESAVALYDVEALPQGEGELGEVYVRFRDTATGNMVERSWTLPYDAYAPAFDRATPTMQLAGTAALMAEKLRGGATGEAIRLEHLAPVVNALRGRYAHEARVQGLVAMFEQMRRLEKE